jgi:hypothetical protein
MAKRLLLPRSQVVGLDGRPISGAKLYTYTTGTSTPKAVYTDAALTVAHANPVIADSAGRFPAMFLGAGDYKTELRDAADTVIATDDPVEGDDAAAAEDIATAALAARRNRLVNPAMQISQQYGTSNTDCTTGSTYVLDQWIGFLSSTPGGTLRVAQVASVTPGGSPYRLRATAVSGSTDTSLAAGDFYTIQQPIEGQMIADARLGSASAKQLLLRLGVRSSIAGTFGVSLGNSATNRSWVGLLTITAGEINTDLERTFTLPGDTAGTWLTDTGVGAYVRVCLAAGTTWQGAADWQAGNLLTTSGQTNFMATGSATFELFDCGFYVDTSGAGVFPPWEMPDAAEELRRCQRYFVYRRQTGSAPDGRICLGTGVVESGVGAYGVLPLPVPMRTAPTVTSGGAWRFLPGGGSATAPTFPEGSNYEVRWAAGNTATGSNTCVFLQGSDANTATLTITARL